MASTQNRETDSLIIRETVHIRDTTVVVNSDSSMIQALIECDSLGKAHIKELQKYRAGERLRPPTVIIRDNLLTATAYADSLQIKITWLERELEHYKNNIQTTEKIEYVEVNRLTWWQTLWVWVGKISAGLIVLIIIINVLRWQKIIKL